ARLEIIEPAAASIHELGQPLPLLAQLEDPDGVVLPVTDATEVSWVDAADDTMLLPALEGTATLAAGVYELAAIANLPNGDRLRSTVGGVRVQTRWSGAYSGDVSLQVEVALPGGGPLVLRCDGPLDFVVSLDGEQAQVEDGECSVQVLGQVFPGSYVIDMDLYSAGLAFGTAIFAFQTPLGAFDLPLEWYGAFYDDRFSTGLDDTVELPLVGAAQVSGSLQALLVDRYIEP
ncbi:MAG: hypothetical protein AB1Z98_22510, partial [Nannocystaceae bacterium]